jgi:hypothetical protein
MAQEFWRSHFPFSPIPFLDYVWTKENAIKLIQAKFDVCATFTPIKIAALYKILTIFTIYKESYWLF